MLLVHPVSELLRFLPALIGVAVLGSQDRGGRWTLLVVAAPIVFGLWRYVTTSYRFTATQIELRRGLVSRRLLSARLDRVRSVDLNSTLLHRVFGLAEVKIGTNASGGDEDSFSLNALAAPDARRLRVQLLHRTREGVATPESAHSEGSSEAPVPADELRLAVPSRSPEAAVEEPDEVLVRFEKSWTRYAPFNATGLAIGLGAVALVNQVGDNAVEKLFFSLDEQALPRVSTWVLVSIAAVGTLLILLLLQVLGYLSTNWGFTFSRDRAGRSWHVRRGLFTTHETSVDTERVRGVTVQEPLLLRLAGGRELAAVVAGGGESDGGTVPLVPSAPRAVVEWVASTVTNEDAVSGALHRHGRRATLRRWNRAMLLAAVLVGALWLAATLGPVSGWIPLVAAAVVVPVSAVLAYDRSRALGHALIVPWLVVRSGSLSRSRDVLSLEGVIGWNLEQSFFQRRAGLANLTATTAAGSGGYTAIDIPLADAAALVATASPGLVTPFLSPPR